MRTNAISAGTRVCYSRYTYCATLLHPILTLLLALTSFVLEVRGLTDLAQLDQQRTMYRPIQSSMAFSSAFHRLPLRFRNTVLQEQCSSGSIRHRAKSAPASARMQQPSISPLSFTPPEGSGHVDEAASSLRQFFKDCGNEGVVIITGAGVSTESGIPDYSYWARSMKGWRPFSLAQPNDAHYSIAALEKHGAVTAVITQNVDALHQKAGSQRVIDLHGRTDLVSCLSCGHSLPRSTFHTDYLEPLNPIWAADPVDTPPSAQAPLRPDGDAAVETDFSAFIVPGCPACEDGVVKPEVVFFGDVVPQQRKDDALDLVLNASGLLVAGSSLSTLSAFRLVDAAVQKSIPVAILNIGPTRAETRGLPVLKVEEKCGPVLSRVAAALQSS